MPRLIRMGDLLARSKKRADKKTDDHILDPEWRSIMNEVYGADVFSVVAGTGYRYFEKSASLVTTGAAYVSEPGDHLSTVRLDYIEPGGRHLELDLLNVEDEGVRSGMSSGADRAYGYTAVDDRIYLYPTPPTGQTYELRYVFQPPDLGTFDDDMCVDVVTPDGEACLVWGTAAIAQGIAKQGVELALKQHEKHRTRLMEWAAERSMNQGPYQATEVSAYDGGPYSRRV